LSETIASDAWITQPTCDKAKGRMISARGVIRAKLTRYVDWRESSPSDELAELDWM
jgi:hypothetical protein